MPVGFAWPCCAVCAGPMQFLAQLLLDDLDSSGTAGAADGRGILSIFMCQNNPGLCHEWDPGWGGNRVLPFPSSGLAPALVPVEGNALRPEASRIDFVVTEADTYGEARDGWAKASGRPLLEVLGQLGGTPSWLQGDETPSCPSCAEPMGFVAQFEEGHDYSTAANFGGGGCGYTFACEPCRQGAFLFQC